MCEVVQDQIWGLLFMSKILHNQHVQSCNSKHNNHTNSCHQNVALLLRIALASRRALLPRVTESLRGSRPRKSSTVRITRSSSGGISRGTTRSCCIAIWWEGRPTGWFESWIRSRERACGRSLGPGRVRCRREGRSLRVIRRGIAGCLC